MDKKLLIGVIGLFVAYAMLPTVGSMVGAALDEADSVLMALAPKVAVVAGIAALIMLCIPFTRHHAHGMLGGAIGLAIGAAAFSVGVPWLEGHSAVLTTDMLNAGDTLLAHMTSQGG